jgi:hypothetical protein
MNGKCVDELIGKYCKIITKEPGGERASVVAGIIMEIDHDAGFLTIESTQGIDCLNIDTIVAIKPRSEMKSAQ